MKPICGIPELLPDTYLISEDGVVYSTINNKILKGMINNYSYHLYRLKLITGEFKWFMSHRLVAFTYLQLPKNPKLEINHIDGNRLNNHYSNLEWITHSDNVLKIYRDQNREPYWTGKKRQPHSVETKLLMSDAKKKKIELYEWGKYVSTYESVSYLCECMSWSRRKYNRICNGDNKRLSKRFTFKELGD